jgi:hypothetical protein
MRTRSPKRLLLVAVIAASLGVSGCSRWLPDFSRVIEPAIVPSRSVAGTDTVERTFPFEGGSVMLRAQVDRAVYAGARSAEKRTVFIGTEKPPDWAAGYYRAFIGEKHQDAFYTSLLSSLHRVRRELGLDSDAYAELVVTMAQQLEYRTDPKALAPKFPIETFADGYGDCDDKTLLAAALLARDGFDVAILMFPAEKHVALGIRATGLEYGKTGYAYVEMTAPLLVGIPPTDVGGGVKLSSSPEVIKVGTGTTVYGAGDQVTYIQRRLKQLRSGADRMRVDIEKQTAQLDRLQASLSQTHDQLTATAAAPADISSYNSRVDAYNTSAQQTRDLVARYNALVDVERYAADNPTDRRGLYQRLRDADL